MAEQENNQNINPAPVEEKRKMTPEEIKEKYPNLIPWEKGKSGNPAGKAKGKNFKTVINELLDNEITVEEAGKRFDVTEPRNYLALQLLKIAFSKYETTENRLKAIEKIMERVDGKPEQPLVGDIDKPINLIINNAESNL